MSRSIRLLFTVILFALLILVRAYGAELFYDPFITYFKKAYLNEAIPEYDSLKLWTSIFFRYLINTVISLVIIYMAFQKKGLVRFSIKFYTAAFVVLSVFYFALLQFEMINGHLFAFYVRRFLIHPVFVLILLPAFYYQKKLVRAR